jgi:hypothetical protein
VRLAHGNDPSTCRRRSCAMNSSAASSTASGMFMARRRGARPMSDFKTRVLISCNAATRALLKSQASACTLIGHCVR